MFDRSKAKARRLARELKARNARSASEAVKKSKVVVIAVKPEAVEGLLREVKDELKGKLVISIAATVPLAYIEKRIPKRARAVVMMPSMAVQAGKGLCVFCLGKRKRGRDANMVKRLFEGAGRVKQVKDERALDAALVSASGIAFIYSFIDALARAGQRAGLSRKDALEFAAATAEGAGEMVLESEKNPAELIEQVATKGGLTERGLQRLGKKGVRKEIEGAMEGILREARRARQKWK